MLWLKENMVNIVIILIIVALLYLCIRNLIKDKKSGVCSCGKSCESCGMLCHIDYKKKLKESIKGS